MTFVEYYNSQFSIVQNLDFFVRIAAACICGACIGRERTRRYKEAGTKTHIIVCCGAAMLMIISKYGFADLAAADGQSFVGTRGADPARIAAQVVSGISFLGAGVIYRHGTCVKGLTTAAGIWTTAAIGLAVGAGMYGIAVFGTIVICLLQSVIHRVFARTDSCRTYKVKISGCFSESLQKTVWEELSGWEKQIIQTKMTRKSENILDYEIIIKLTHEISYNEVYQLVNKKAEEGLLNSIVIRRM